MISDTHCSGPELVFINILVRGKKLVQNWSFCESALKSVFPFLRMLFTKNISVYVSLLIYLVKIRRWVRLLKQQLSITVYRLPTKGNKLPFSVYSKQTEVCRFRFSFAANKRQLPFSVCSLCVGGVRGCVRVCVCICCHFKWKTGYGIQGDFP